jgi:hypothetical protein
MSEQAWPIDKIGNQIREGRLVIVKWDEPDAMFYVDKVNPASFLHSPGGTVIPVNGEIELVLKIKLPFAPDARQMGRAIVVEQPDPDKVS